MNKSFRLLSLIALLALISFACAFSPQALLAGSGPTATTSNILFQDDFSKTTGGWDTLSDIGLIGYENNAFHFWVNETSMDYWSTPGLNFTDVHIEVDATMKDGPEDNDFGVLCRYQDANNFYGLLISSDGYYGISKMKDGNHAIIEPSGMQFSDVIRTGKVTNRIQADCIGDTLTLSVNGHKMQEIQDADFTSGDVGLLAGTFDIAGTDIYFDNFIVERPR